jgi:hypothetical protein
MYIFLLLLPLLNINYWEKYTQPKAEDLYLKLSKNLREEVQDNFYILKTVKYEHTFIKEHLLNVSKHIKNTLLEKKMENRRKMDYLFARHINMINIIHKKAEKNLFQLEYIRKSASDTLADLKENHINMLHRLNKNQEDINNKLEIKKENHMDLMTTYYKNWKDKREEILDIIDF